MKKLVVLLFPLMLLAQEQKLKLTIKDVNVYRSGAQISSEALVNLPKGTSELVFGGLSPYVDQGSIQVNGLKDATILSISYNQNYLDKKTQSEKIEGLEKAIKTKNREIALVQNQNIGLQEEESLLKNNQNLQSEQQAITLDKVTAFSKYYRERMTALKTELFDNNLKISELQKEINNLNNEISKLRGDAKEQRGEIVVKIDAQNPSSLTLGIKYNVTEAGWFPIYDIKTNSIKEPLKVHYKAHVYQQTGDDWNNVKVTLSTGDPSQNNTNPDVVPHYLDFTNYYNQASSVKKYNYKYNPMVKTVTGVVTDTNGEALPGVTVLLKGTRNGTQTDFDGKYTINIAQGSELVFSYIGMKDQTIPVYAQQMYVRLENDESQLNEVVVTAMGIKRESDFDGMIDRKGAGMDKNNNGVPDDLENSESETVGVKVKTTATGDVKEENITNTVFKINKIYSIASSDEVSVIPIDDFEVETEYEYFTAPVLNENVFLTAKLKNWEQFDLISGEANVYFEGNYAGKTFIDPSQTQEELIISLGVDPTLVVERKQLNNMKDKSLMGSTRTVKKEYEISIRNNKATDVEIVLKDRVPLTQNKEIKVEKITHTANEYDEKTGVLTWKVSLKAKESVKKQLTYEVKYPNGKRINL